ncbi:MAG: 8-amino-7-oxononanoate synthase [Gemmatimonadaceae bacterium]|nr:8-amino-7-oxononanoate synthase [Chitinophagaceae bacterium]
MMDEFLDKKLGERREKNALRVLKNPSGQIDFCSNDYLGIATQTKLSIHQHSPLKTGSTGSRLLSGNYPLIEETESLIAKFHNASAALIFNSGYDANIGIMSSVPQKNDTILYDYLSHASLRDGIRLSFATAHSFLHNDLGDLEKKLQHATGNIFVITESIFSMDGDEAPLPQIAALCKTYKANLVVDEAHATGLVGPKGAGLIQKHQLENDCFARIHTFGKALGCHGAAILGSEKLRQYLINFSRPFIYTTAMPPSAVAEVKSTYHVFPTMETERKQLVNLTRQFRSETTRLRTIDSQSPIQAVIIPGNEEVKKKAEILQKNNLDIRPILYPTVPKGEERLRIVLHAFNSGEEISTLTRLLNS